MGEPWFIQVAAVAWVLGGWLAKIGFVIIGSTMLWWLCVLCLAWFAEVVSRIVAGKIADALEVEIDALRDRVESLSHELQVLREQMTARQLE